MLGVAFGLGFVLGPAIGGLLGGSNPRLPFWVAAGLSTLNFGYGLFALPESLPVEHRSRFEWRRANPLGSLRLLREHPGLGGLAWVNFLAQLGHASLPSVFVLYASYRYHWGERMVGLTLAGVGVCSAVVQGGLVGPIVARLGERRALLLGLLFGSVGFAIYGLAPSGALFFLGVPVMAIWGVSGPAIQGLMSSRVGMTEQGKLQGANSSLMGIAELVGPGLYTGAFAYFIGHGALLELPGAPFLLAASLLAAAAFVSLRAAPVTVANPVT
ncbi:MAG TPA: MFS transporter [Polyangiaceae bacterium]|jgi:DHA1 family tetracycline resistance protein-like MFS transporter